MIITGGIIASISFNRQNASALVIVGACLGFAALAFCYDVHRLADLLNKREKTSYDHYLEASLYLYGDFMIVFALTEC
jgi:hypothetical protein